uniref:Metaxin 2 n=1 Tax=Cynoglossus semilaevis TaxID=244447 RepID=A0A3P8WF58_CYNSE
MSLATEAFMSQIAAAEPWPENATLYQPLREDQILLSDCASSLAVQAFLRMCGLPVQVVCRANAEYMSPSGKIPFIHVGNQVVSELGPIVQFTKAKGHSLSAGLDDVQRAEMKAYMELVNNMLLTAEISRPRYSSPYSWPLNNILAFQKQWEVRRKMNAIGWGGKTLEKVYEDVSQCFQALSQRLGTQTYFFAKQYVCSIDQFNFYLYKPLYELLPPSGWRLVIIQALQQWYTYVQRVIFHWKPLTPPQPGTPHYLRSTGLSHLFSTHVRTI